MKITILSENYAANTDYAEWGFCALIEQGSKRILFDTGFTGTCVLENCKKLKVSLTNLDAIILSHGHDDHTGGLEDVLNHTKCRTIYAHPDLFSKRFVIEDEKYLDISCPHDQAYFEQKYGVTFHLHSTFFELLPNIFMTGEVPFTNSFEKLADNLVIKNSNGNYIQDKFPDDNSLIVKTDKGLIIIFGCAHRGIINIMNYIKTNMDESIYAIVGGAHLYNATDEHYKFVEDFIKQENIQQLSPGHCTGMNRIFDLTQTFKDKVKPAFCGTVLTF